MTRHRYKITFNGSEPIGPEQHSSIFSWCCQY